MQFEEQKIFLEKALIDSFVEEYESYKKTIEYINSDLTKSNINFQYTYDQFCVDFLNQTLSNIENIDIFGYDEFNNFYINFWNFNLNNLQSMLSTKLNELGYSYEDFYERSKLKDTIENSKN